MDQEKRDDVEWLFQCMLTTLKDAMQNAGPLFAFVPEFYVEACISAYSALKSYFTPSLLSLHSPGTWFIFLISARGMICFRLFQSAVAAMLRLCDCAEFSAYGDPSLRPLTGREQFMLYVKHGPVQPTTGFTSSGSDAGSNPY